MVWTYLTVEIHEYVIGADVFCAVVPDDFKRCMSVKFRYRPLDTAHFLPNII